MRLHGVRNCDHSIHCEGNPQWRFHYPHNVRYLTICDRCLRQMQQIVVQEEPVHDQENDIRLERP